MWLGSRVRAVIADKEKADADKEKVVATLAEEKMQREELAAQNATLVAELENANSLAATAVADFQAGPDFNAAISVAVVKGARWISKVLSQTFTDKSARIADVSEGLIQDTFPDVAVPEDDEEPSTVDVASSVYQSLISLSILCRDIFVGQLNVL